MKNLITDKPTPITVALGQAKNKAKGDDKAGVFTLMDQNVTKGQMKNLITDKPTPITVALGQAKNKAKGDDKAGVFTLMDQNVTKGQVKNLLATEKKGVPVLVNPVIMQNTEGETNLGLKLLVGPDEVSVAKKKAAAAAAKAPA